MSGVLHPVGPEPAGTYWARRFLVAAVAVLLVLGVVLGTTAGNGRATVTAKPPPAVATSPTPTPTALSTGTASPRVSPTSSASAAPRPAAPRTAVRVPTRAKPSATKAAPTKPRPTKATSRRKASTKATPAKPTPPPVPRCAPAQLRATLTGKRVLRVEQAAVFNLSLINGSKAVCRVQVSRHNFELKIYSGTDRIWSTRDCTRAVPPLDRIVRSEEAVEWRLRWNGQRSEKNCEERPEAPRPGTYFATAQLKGAKPIQLGMILGG